MVKLSNYLSQQQQLIDEKLRSLLVSYQALCPPLHEAMHYAVFSGGKRIRPILVIAAAEAVGGRGPEALSAAAAVELMHTYTLIHDDLPAMDDDELRRGQPTVHVKFGEANAILAGDALQAVAFSAVAESPNAPLLFGELAEAGVRVVAGQWQDMAAETQAIGLPALPGRQAGGAVGESDIQFIHEYKTANLLRASVRMGASCGGATPEQLEALTHYGTAIGHVFQLIDDILDAGSEDKPTAVTVYGLEKTQEQARLYFKQAQQAVASLPHPETLIAIAELIHNRTS